MKSITVLGIFARGPGRHCARLSGFSRYTRQVNVIDVGPIHATRDDTQHVLLPPIVGGIALLGGAALLVIGAKQKA